MYGVLDNIMAAILLVNLALVGSSRLSHCVKLVGLQGILVGLLPLFSHAGFSVRSCVLALVVVSLKGIVFPHLLGNAVRNANVRHEVEPFVGYGVSLLIGTLMLTLSFWLAGALPLPGVAHSRMVIAGAVYTILIGLFLIVSRRKAVTQVMGYLVIENGIAAFGLALVPEIPILIELGILLDAFVAVFVMAIMIYHISREFDHMDTDRLSTLKG